VSRAVRLTLLTEIPAPYRVPIFNALAEREDIVLRVVFLRKGNPKRPYPISESEYRFDSEILPGFHFMRGSRWVVVNAAVGRALRRGKPDAVVIGGWAQPAFWTALAVAKLRRLPALAWVESTSRDERSGHPLLESVKRRFLRSCDGFIVPGSASSDYLRGLGVPDERIAVAPNAVDFELFRLRVDELRFDVGALRERLGVSGVCVLCVGRLDPEKGIDVAVEAVARLATDVSLVIAGIGPEEASLRALAAAVAPGRVRFLGFVQPARLAEWYAAADVFVLPSRSEQWSIPLNEAAVAGLPLVATDAAGASYELVEEGGNGFRVPAGDVDGFSRALGWLATDVELRRRAGRRSRELAVGFTPEAWAESVAALTRRALG